MDFVNTFFRQTLTFTSTEIPIDQLVSQNALAGYRARSGQANVLAYNPGRGIPRTPPIISVITPVSEDLAGAVTVGMEPNAPANEHLLRKYANIQRQHEDAIYNQIAKQAADVLLYGKFDLLDSLGNKVGEPIDFERDSALTITAAYASDPVKQISDGFAALNGKNFPKSGAFALVGDTVLARLQQDTKFLNLLKVQGLNAGKVWVSPDNRVVAQLYTGMISGMAFPVTLCSFSAAYEKADGTSVSFIPEKAVVVGSFNDPRVQAYGGIFITDPVRRMGEMYEGQVITDRILTQNPDELSIRSQSAPLLIPGFVDHTATVISSD
jgi:hypothetical protein